jgi:two-component system OmpR family sensor kinase
MNSIRRTLLLWLSVGLSIGIMAAAALIYAQAREQANTLFDYQMRQLVASLPAEAFGPMAPNHGSGEGSGAVPQDAQDDIVVEIRDVNGMQIYRSHRRILLPQRIEIGFSDVLAQGSAWRVYSVQMGGKIVQIAQPQSARAALAARMALKTVSPLLLLLPFLAGLIWFTVGRGLVVVQRVVADVQARDAHSLAPLSDAGLPQEIQPLTQALNQLLRRLDLSIGAQRSFIADAAHELKTPLTALRLQIQLAERATDTAARAAAFADVKQGLARASHLVHQLLTLARQEPGAVEQPPEAVDLTALARLAVADLAAAAANKHIDLGLQADAGAAGAAITVNGNPDALRTLLNNLIDNAIRYCPEGASIDVVINAAMRNGPGGASIAVQDNGPGIPEADLARVMDRFYRVAGSTATGSGLGLAIVKQIATAHGAQVRLENTHPGLRAIVQF